MLPLVVATRSIYAVLSGPIWRRAFSFLDYHVEARDPPFAVHRFTTCKVWGVIWGSGELIWPIPARPSRIFDLCLSQLSEYRGVYCRVRCAGFTLALPRCNLRLKSVILLCKNQ